MEIIFVIIVFVSMITGWIKIGARNDRSKSGAKYIGSLVYTDYEGNTRLVSNDHLCTMTPIGGIGGIYLRTCDNTTINPICDVDYTDLKTHEVINPAKEKAKELLTERLQKAKKTGSDEMIFVVKRYGTPLSTQKSRTERRAKNIQEQISYIKRMELSTVISGNCYCTPTTDIDASVYDRFIPDDAISKCYIVKSISHKDHPSWHLDFYMSVETGLLYKPTEAQLKMERFIKNNLGIEYKSFSDEEIQEFMAKFNEEQLKRQVIALKLAEQTIFIDDIAKIYYNNTLGSDDAKLNELYTANYSINNGDYILEAEAHKYLKFNKYDFTKETPYMQEVEERRII